MKKKKFFLFLLGFSLVFNLSKSMAADFLSRSNPKEQALFFYKGIVANSNEKTRLPESHIGDPRLREWCHTYDAAVCVIALLALGDRDRALAIMNFYIENKALRRLGGVIEAILSFSREGRGINWQVRSGSNAWLGIAAFHCYLATQESRYLDFAKKQADFLLTLQDENPTAPTYGGVPLGPKGVEYNTKDQHILWDENGPEFVDIYSTEVNIDVWALLNMITSVSAEPKYQMAKTRVEKWLRSVGFNEEEKRMNRGYSFKPDLLFAPDTHFWIVSALGPDILDKWAPNLSDQLMKYAQEHAEVQVRYAPPDRRKIDVVGYDFIDKKDPLIQSRGEVVSPEWTFQAVLAYSLLSQQSPNPDLVLFYQFEKEELLKSILAMTEVDGKKAYLPYATKGDVAIGHEFNTPAQGTRSVVSSAWAILALLDYDPLNLEKAQVFWKNR